MINGIDVAAYTPPHLPCIKAAGYTFIARYLAGWTHIAGKLLTLFEAQAIAAAGLQIVAVWEQGSPTTAGYFTLAQGQADGKAAVDVSLVVGQPDPAPIYVAVDCDLGPQAIASGVIPYFQGLSEYLDVSTLGVYGSGLVCSSLLDKGLVSRTWLAESRGWAGSAGFDKWQIKQTKETLICGLTVDLDEAQGDFGSWQPL